MATTLSFSDIQDRVDKIYAKDLFQPNAFYPTTMVMEVPPSKENKSQIEFKKISLSRDKKPLDLADFLLFFVNGPNFSGSYLQGASEKTLEWYIGIEDSFKSPPTSGTREFDYANLNNLIPYLLSVDGLKTPKLPYVKKNGRLTVESFSGASNCTLKFLASKEGEVLQNLLAWQSHWATYDFEKRSVASAFNKIPSEELAKAQSDLLKNLSESSTTKVGPTDEQIPEYSVLFEGKGYRLFKNTYDKEEGSFSSEEVIEAEDIAKIPETIKVFLTTFKTKASAGTLTESYTKDGEVYLGLDYLNIKPDGTTERVGHLFMFGLIPVEIKPSWSGYGPQASTSGVPTIEVSCIYSHAFLGMPIKNPENLKQYQGTGNTSQNVRFLVFE